jgi:hypothetical protein
MGLVLDHYAEPSHLKLTLLILADHCDAEGLCWPSYATVAARACCSRRQAITNVQRLIDTGFVEVVELGGRRPNGRGGANVSNLFRVNEHLLASLPRLTATVDKSAEKVRRLHRRGEVDFTSTGEVKRASPKPSVEPSQLTIRGVDPVDSSSPALPSPPAGEKSGSFRRLSDVLENAPSVMGQRYHLPTTDTNICS